ncbi:MAG: transposase [Chloroflexota bacterium]|nr:transposase [Chloroflexota bacterium]
MVCLDDLVPADDDLRRIEVLVDWEHVRETARPFYRAGGAGRRGLDPAVLVKFALVLAWRGMPSMRAVLRVAETDMSIRRFLGFGLMERLPDHSTFSHAQTKRFADSSVFEQLFTAVLRQCTDAGLVGGRRLLIDGTHIEADAALKSLRAELEPIDGDGDGDGIVAGGFAEPRPALKLAESRSGPTPKRVASNATAVSRTDLDAKLRHKPGHRKHLVHRGQVAVDPKARVIVAVQAERATGSEADCLSDIVTRARFAGHAVTELAADAGYASEASYVALDKLKTTALIPPQPNAKHERGEPGTRADAPPRPAVTRRLTVKRTPRARSQNSNATAPTARDAAAPGSSSSSCSRRRPRSTSNASWTTAAPPAAARPAVRTPATAPTTPRLAPRPSATPRSAFSPTP